MTLVAGFSMGGPPAFVGDLLTSWRIPIEVQLPTRPNVKFHKTSDGNFASGLAQKLIIVRPYLLIAWAGSVSEAKKLIISLDAELPEVWDNSKESTHSLLSTLDKIPNSIELVAVLQSQKWLQPFCMHTCGFTIDEKRFYHLGGGTEEAFKFLLDMTEHMPKPDNSQGIAAVSVLINFVGNALMAQHQSRYGLDASWGGGFEVVRPTKSGFKKVDNILVRCWSLSPTWEVGNSGTSFLLHYDGFSLKISSFGRSEQVTIVKSWLQDAALPLVRSEVIAEWTVDLFFIEATGQRVCAVQFDYPWSRETSHFFFSQGDLVGWHMNKDRVAKIVRRIKDGAAYSPFSVSPI